MLGFTPRSNAGPYNISIFSRSCGIDMRDLYVVIGGVENDKGIRKVAIYNDNGFERTLPDLILGRYGHACARFQNGNGDMVSVMLFKS